MDGDLKASPRRRGSGRRGRLVPAGGRGDSPGSWSWGRRLHRARAGMCLVLPVEDVVAPAQRPGPADRPPPAQVCPTRASRRGRCVPRWCGARGRVLIVRRGPGRLWRGSGSSRRSHVSGADPAGPVVRRRRGVAWPRGLPSLGRAGLGRAGGRTIRFLASPARHRVTPTAHECRCVGPRYCPIRPPGPGRGSSPPLGGAGGPRQYPFGSGPSLAEWMRRIGSGGLESLFARCCPLGGLGARRASAVSVTRNPCAGTGLAEARVG